MLTIFDRRCCNRGPFGGFFKTLLLLMTSFVIAIISSSSAGFANAALTPSEVNGNPVLLLVSCDQLTEPRTSVKGIVILMADITCDEPRVRAVVTTSFLRTPYYAGTSYFLFSCVLSARHSPRFSWVPVTYFSKQLTPVHFFLFPCVGWHLS